MNGRLACAAILSLIAALPLANGSPVALIEIILAGAMGLRASDIHTEAGEKKAKSASVPACEAAR